LQTRGIEAMKIKKYITFITFIKHSPHIIKVFILLYLLLIASGPAFSQETGKVQKVYDGDTVLLSDGRKVRYLGINTPEWQEPFYLKVKRLNELLVMGEGYSPGV